MVKKDNNFTLYLLKAMLLILIITIFFIIPTKTALASPLPSINVIAVATESGLVKIASLAYEPRGPIKPNKKLNILIAGVLGLFVGIFVAFFLEFWQKGK